MRILLLTLLMTFLPNTFARGDRQMKVPPQSAISACEGKETGATCSTQGRNGEQVTGTCKMTKDNNYFACKPQRRKR